MILSSREVEALRLAGRIRAIMELTGALLNDLGDEIRRGELVAYLEDNKSTVAALTDLDMTEARYIIGLGYMRRKNVRSLLDEPQIAAIQATAARKLKLERLYRKELRTFLA